MLGIETFKEHPSTKVRFSSGIMLSFGISVVFLREFVCTLQIVLTLKTVLYQNTHKGRLFFGSRQPSRSFRGGRKLRFFGRAIFDKFYNLFLV